MSENNIVHLYQVHLQELKLLQSKTTVLHEGYNAQLLLNCFREVLNQLYGHFGGLQFVVLLTCISLY